MIQVKDLVKDFQIPVVKTHGQFSSVNTLLEFTRPLLNLEGFVVTWPNGYKVKVKADEYLQIHKLKETISTERHICGLVVNGNVDDCKDKLDSEDIQNLEDYEKAFHLAFSKTLHRLQELSYKALEYETRKELALNFIPTLENKEDARFIFSYLDGKDLKEQLLAKIKQDVTNTTRYDRLKEWMGLEYE